MYRLVGLVVLAVMMMIRCASAHPQSQPTALAQMDQLRYDVMATIDQLWETLWETNEIQATGQDTKLMDSFRVISAKLTDDAGDFGPFESDLDFAQLREDVTNVNTYFETFLRLQQQPVRWRHELAWADMANYLTEKSEKGVNGTLTKLNSYRHLFDKIREDSTSNICELHQSQQQMIYRLYNMISLAELKGYAMLQFAWMLLKIYDKGNFKTEADLMRNLYTERTIGKMNAAKEAMAGANRSVYKCDPRNWIEGENFVRMTKLLQGYIENEVNLNSEGTCGQNCAYYGATRYYGCFKQQFCSKQPPCRGEVLRCSYYDSDMNICQSNSKDRRYDWIEYENHVVLGRQNTCPSRNLHKVDSWWRYLFWHCSYCMCVCDDVGPSSDRFFSLRTVKSNISENKVITGVRFVKTDQIIHIQIQEGKLEARGVVNQSQTEWVPVRSFRPMDNDVANGRDYFTMNHTHRAIDLDDAIAPPSYALTAVRLWAIGPNLNLEIGATPFDFTTGKLDDEAKSIWVTNTNTDGAFKDPRTEITLSDPDVPTRKGLHSVISKHDQVIKFRESSLKSDVAQSTVPYLDAQPLESNGEVLSGLGIVYKGAPNSGGFVALKTITYDYSQHMAAQMPVA